MFKKLLLLLILSLTPLHLFADEVGIVDMLYLFEKDKIVIKSRESFQEKAEDYKKLLEKHQQKIEEALEKKKSEKAITKLVKKRDEEMEPKKLELQQYEMSVEQNFKMRVEATTKKVANAYSIDVVVDRQAVLFGGFDLTNIVLDRLNQDS